MGSLSTLTGKARSGKPEQARYSPYLIKILFRLLPTPPLRRNGTSSLLSLPIKILFRLLPTPPLRGEDASVSRATTY